MRIAVLLVTQKLAYERSDKVLLYRCLSLVDLTSMPHATCLQIDTIISSTHQIHLYRVDIATTVAYYL